MRAPPKPSRSGASREEIGFWRRDRGCGRTRDLVAKTLFPRGMPQIWKALVGRASQLRDSLLSRKPILHNRKMFFDELNRLKPLFLHRKISKLPPKFEGFRG